MIVDDASATNTPPARTSASSSLHSTATVPIAPPSASAPTSPIIIEAGYALNHRKPSDAAITDAQKIATSPTFAMYGICR